MICSNCREDVNGVWEEDFDSSMMFVCENCGDWLESENSYEDSVWDALEDYNDD